MRKILSFLIYTIVFFFCIFYFLPKESLYNYLEHELKKEKVIISDETRVENIFNFSINNSRIFYKGINISEIKKVDFTTYLFNTKIEVNDVKLLGSITNLAPSPISKISLSHSILDYKKIKIVANGSFGVLNGELDIFTKTMTLRLKANKIMKSKYSNILREMKLKEGEYLYEYKF